MYQLAGKVAIVTGAGQGIGRQYAMALARAGAMICVSDIAEPTQTVEEIRQAGCEAFGVACNVTKSEMLNRMVEEVGRKYGRADVLVNNAALFGTLNMTSFADISEDEWDRVMTVNVRGTWQTAKAVVPLMKESGGGKIINISSATVFKGTPKLLHYVASKGAIVALTRSLAREVAEQHICVNAIAPGLVASDNVKDHPDWKSIAESIIATRALKREAVPSDLIGALLFFSSDASDFITGQTSVVDGGVVMH